MKLLPGFQAKPENDRLTERCNIKFPYLYLFKNTICFHDSSAPISEKQTMSKLKLYWAFFKSTFTISFVFSFILALIIYPLFFNVFPIALMTGGPIISLFYKELFRRNEYYFFYNRGISKINLLATSLVFHFTFGFIVFIIFRWVVFLK